MAINVRLIYSPLRRNQTRNDQFVTPINVPKIPSHADDPTIAFNRFPSAEFQHATHDSLPVYEIYMRGAGSNGSIFRKWHARQIQNLPPFVERGQKAAPGYPRYTIFELYSSNAPISWMGRMGSERGGGGWGGLDMEGSKTWRVEVTCRAFMTRIFSFIPYNGAIENCLGDTCQSYGAITRTGRKQGGKCSGNRRPIIPFHSWEGEDIHYFLFK